MIFVFFFTLPLGRVLMLLPHAVSLSILRLASIAAVAIVAGICVVIRQALLGLPLLLLILLLVARSIIWLRIGLLLLAMRSIISWSRVLFLHVVWPSCSTAVAELLSLALTRCFRVVA